MPEIYSEQLEQESQSFNSPTKKGNILRYFVLITAILFTILNTTWCVYRAATISPSERIFSAALCFVSVGVSLLGIISASNQLKQKVQLQFSALYVIGLAVLFIAESSFIVYLFLNVGRAEAQIGGFAFLIGAAIGVLIFFFWYGALGMIGLCRVIQLILFLKSNY